MTESQKNSNQELVNQKEIEKKIIESRPEISQLLANNPVKKVYEGKSEGIDEYTNDDISGIRFWKKEYYGIEFYKGQKNTKQGKEAVQEIPQNETKTPSLMEETTEKQEPKTSQEKVVLANASETILTNDNNNSGSES
jgi:hypothetical protein